MIAERDSGELLGGLSTRGRNNHFDTLRFLNGAGAFSPDSRRIAFVVERRGRQGIAITTVPELEIRETLFFEDIESISQLAWSSTPHTTPPERAWSTSPIGRRRPILRFATTKDRDWNL